jgi:hypothetical protein
MLSIPIVTSFVDDGIRGAIKEFKQLETTGQKAQFALKKAAVPAAAAMAGLGAALFDATKGAMEDAAAQDLLANNLRKTTGATDAQIAANEDWISTQGRLLGVTDDKLRPALSRLAKATGDVQEAQKLASQAMDISAATGKPLEAVVASLEKAYGGNLTALAKLAPEYRDLIKDGATFEEVMAKIAKTTGGTAAEAANTAAGRMQRLSVAIGETKESIGSSLLPVIEAALPKLNKLSDWAQKNPEVFTTVAIAIGGIATATMAVNAAMAVNPYVLAAAGVVALAVAFEQLYRALDKMSRVGGVAARLLGQLLGGPLAGGNLIGSIFGPERRSASGGSSAADFRMFDMANIPGLAQGGIVTSPTLALIGEGNGPEAVVPLSRAGEFGMGGGNNVTINVNGGDPQQVVNALRRYMQLNGSVPIRVSS